MDSRDFAVSESNFSMSRRSGGGGFGASLDQKAQKLSLQRQRSGTGAPEQKRQGSGFYAADYGKFTSIVSGDQSQGAVEEDIK